jgi:hypothetical protein
MRANPKRREWAVSYRRTAEIRGLRAEDRGAILTGGKNQTTKRRTRCEIENQPDLNPCCFQVIHELQFVNGNDLIGNLRLDDHLSLDNQIGAVVSDIFAEEHDGYRLLTLASDTSTCEQDVQRALIDGFHESVPEHPVHIVESSDDFLGDIAMQQINSRARSSQNISPRMSASLSANFRGSSVKLTIERPSMGAQYFQTA